MDCGEEAAGYVIVSLHLAPNVLASASNNEILDVDFGLVNFRETPRMLIGVLFSVGKIGEVNGGRVELSNLKTKCGSITLRQLGHLVPWYPG